MKTVIINYDGSLLDISKLRAIVSYVKNNTDTDSVHITQLDDAETANALMSVKTFADEHKAKPDPEKATMKELLISFCEELQSKLSPDMKSNILSIGNLLMTDDELRKHNTDVIKYLIESGRLNPIHRYVLTEFGLNELPAILKQIHKYGTVLF